MLIKFVYIFRRKIIIKNAQVLFRGLVKYLDSFFESSGVDPFLRDCTLAGACMRVFRTNYLERLTIGAYPPGGYRLARKPYSKKAIRWLRHLEKTEVRIFTRLYYQSANRRRNFSFLRQQFAG